MKLPPLNKTVLGLSGLGIAGVSGIASGVSGNGSSPSQDPFAPAETLSREEVILPAAEPSDPAPNRASQSESRTQNSPAPAAIEAEKKPLTSGPTQESRPKATLPSEQPVHKGPSQTKGPNPAPSHSGQPAQPQPSKPNPSTPQQQRAQKPAAHPKAPEAPKHYTYADEKADLWSTPSSEANSNNREFSLATYTCSKVLFGGAAMPDNGKGPEEVVLNEDPDSSFVNSKPQDDWTTANSLKHGCLLMNMQTGNNHLTFRSELAVKNEKMGFVLWIGMRENTIKKWTYSVQLSLMVNYRIAMFAKEGESWNIKSAYSWTFDTNNHIPYMNQLLIPTKPNSLLYGVDQIEDTEAKFQSHGALMTNQTGRNTTEFTLGMGNTFPSQKNEDFSGPLTFNPIEINLPVQADSFYYGAEADGKTWNWKKLKKDGNDLKLDVKDSVESWIKPFLGKHKWLTMKEACRNIRARKEGNPQHMDHVCLTDRDEKKNNSR